MPRQKWHTSNAYTSKLICLSISMRSFIFPQEIQKHLARHRSTYKSVCIARECWLNKTAVSCSLSGSASSKELSTVLIFRLMLVEKPHRTHRWWTKYVIFWPTEYYECSSLSLIKTKGGRIVGIKNLISNSKRAWQKRPSSARLIPKKLLLS